MRKYIFLISVFFLPLFSDIILFDGLCSAGKTSVCSELKKNNQEIAWIDQDAILFTFFARRIKDILPYEYEVLSKGIEHDNFYHAIRRKQILFKEGLSDMEKLACIKVCNQLNQMFQGDAYHSFIYDNLKEYTYELIDNFVAEGKDIVIDSWLFTNHEDVQKLKELDKTILVLAYCPLEELINRVEMRNKKSILNHRVTELRYYKLPIMSFHNYFIFSNKEAGSVETVKIDSLNHVFKRTEENISLNCVMPKELSNYEMTLEELLTYKLKMLKLIRDGYCFIIPPDLPYDLIIDTSKDSPKALAQMVEEFLKNFSEDHFGDSCHNLALLKDQTVFHQK